MKRFVCQFFTFVLSQASVSGITRITDRMLYLAAETIANSLTAEEIEQGRTFPDISRIRDVSKAVALAVIEEGIREDLCLKLTKRHLKEGLSNLLDRKMYWPVYSPIVAGPRHHQ
jgi:malate dehydrogenase (oxaloacetate-decarboxylating)(NADP+)